MTPGTSTCHWRSCKEKIKSEIKVTAEHGRSRKGTGPPCWTPASPEARGPRREGPAAQTPACPYTELTQSLNRELASPLCAGPQVLGKRQGARQAPQEPPASPPHTPSHTPRRAGPSGAQGREAEAALDVNSIQNRALPAPGSRGSGGPAPQQALKPLLRWPRSLPGPWGSEGPTVLPAWRQGFPSTCLAGLGLPVLNSPQSRRDPAGAPSCPSPGTALGPAPCTCQGTGSELAQQEGPQSRPRPEAKASLPVPGLGLTCQGAEARGP